MGHDPITVIRWYAELAKMDRTDAAVQVAEATRARRGDRRPAPAGGRGAGSVGEGRREVARLLRSQVREASTASWYLVGSPAVQASRTALPLGVIMIS